MTSQQQVADYYDQTLRLYKIFWHSNKSYAIHYGYWDSKTKNHQEALLNMNKFMAKAAKIPKGAKILDAGCGIGGSSIWLAKNLGANVTGITLSQGQIKTARKLAEANNLQDSIEFKIQDYMKTPFANGSFDVVWGLESICYANTKKQFLTEAYRLLKPKGKVIIADGFLHRDVNDDEKQAYADFLEGFVLPDLAKVEDFKKWMSEVGFKNVKYWDTSKEAWPSSKIMYRRVSLFYPMALLTYKLGLVSRVLFMNSRAGLGQYKLVKQGAAGYGVFYGEK